MREVRRKEGGKVEGRGRREGCYDSAHMYDVHYPA